MKITSKSPSQHPVRLHGKLKQTEQREREKEKEREKKKKKKPNFS
jgi:hypothetical protein